MLQVTVDRLVYGMWGLDPSNRWAQALNFFIYDSVKIMALLFVMIAVIGFLRTFLPAARVKAWLSGRGGLGYFLAAVFGSVTPFCSCSSIPLFLSFLKAGVPLGVTFAFLITSPLINEYLVVLMLGFFGWKITAVYVAGGLMIGTLSGLVLGRMSLERYLEADLMTTQASGGDIDTPRGLRLRLRFGLQEAVDIVRKLWGWVLVGVALGAVIHNFVPQETIQGLMHKTGVWSVPLATVLGVPMYGSCAAIVPVAVVLFQKGIPLGTALAFMMAVSALSLPEAIMLRRAMTLPLIAFFFAVTTAAIIVTGYVLNLLQPLL